MRKKKKIVEEPPVEEEETEKEKIPEPVEPSLEEKLLEIYEGLEGYISIQELVHLTGTSELEISLSWHHLFDEGKVGSPMFYRVGKPKPWGQR